MNRMLDNNIAHDKYQNRNYLTVRSLKTLLNQSYSFLVSRILSEKFV